MNRCFYFKNTNSETGKEMTDWIVIIPDYVDHNEVVKFIFDLRSMTIYSNKRYVDTETVNGETTVVGSKYTGEYFETYAKRCLKDKYNAVLFTKFDGMVWM